MHGKFMVEQSEPSPRRYKSPSLLDYEVVSNWDKGGAMVLEEEAGIGILQGQPLLRGDDSGGLGGHGVGCMRGGRSPREALWAWGMLVDVHLRFVRRIFLLMVSR